MKSSGYIKKAGNVVKAFFAELKKYVSPVFVAMLLLSAFMWYMIKLGHTYTADVPVEIEVAGNHFRVECVAEADGYKLLARRTYRKTSVALQLGDIQVSPSMVNDGNYIINAHSLQNAISVRVGDMRIVSVGEIPEIRLDNN